MITVSTSIFYSKYQLEIFKKLLTEVGGVGNPM